MRSAVFLDKDGTLIDDIPYNVDPAKIQLAADAIEGLQRLSAAGFLLLVVSNQSGVARGIFPESALAAVGARLEILLAEFGVPLAGFSYCPHHPEGTVAKYARACDCRKPLPGMILRAAREHGVDLGRSWMIGDILNDVEAGHRAGCRSILIAGGPRIEADQTPQRTPFATVATLNDAARVILDHRDP